MPRAPAFFLIKVSGHLLSRPILVYEQARNGLKMVAPRASPPRTVEHGASPTYMVYTLPEPLCERSTVLKSLTKRCSHD